MYFSFKVVVFKISSLSPIFQLIVYVVIKIYADLTLAMYPFLIAFHSCSPSSPIIRPFPFNNSCYCVSLRLRSYILLDSWWDDRFQKSSPSTSKLYNPNWSHEPFRLRVLRLNCLIFHIIPLLYAVIFPHYEFCFAYLFILSGILYIWFDIVLFLLCPLFFYFEFILQYFSSFSRETLRHFFLSILYIPSVFFSIHLISYHSFTFPFLH